MAGPKVSGGTEGPRTYRTTFAVGIQERNTHWFVLTGNVSRQALVVVNQERFGKATTSLKFNLKVEQRERYIFLQRFNTYILCCAVRSS